MTKSYVVEWVCAWLWTVLPSHTACVCVWHGRYYRHATGCVFVYDVTNRKSFARVKFWMSEVAQYVLMVFVFGGGRAEGVKDGDVVVRTRVRQRGMCARERVVLHSMAVFERESSLTVAAGSVCVCVSCGV